MIARRYVQDQCLASKQKIPLRHRQLVRRFAHQQLAVRPHVIGLGVDLDLRRRAIVDHALLADLAARVLDRDQAPLHVELARQAPRERRLGDKSVRRAVQGFPVRAEHRAVVDGLGGRDRGVGVAHERRGDRAALDDAIGLHAEEGGRP